MKRILFILTTLVLVLLSGCDLRSLIGATHEQVDPDAPPKVYKSTAPKIMFDKIISALDDEDSEALKDLFAPNALAKAPGLDDQIAALMDLYRGILISNSAFDSGGSVAEMIDGNYVYLHISPAIHELVTDQAEYTMAFDAVSANNETPDDVGLWRILLQLKDGEDIRKERVVGTWYPGRDN